MKDTESSLQFDGLDISVTRGVDGIIVVQIDGPGDEDIVSFGNYAGSPDIRIYMNDCLTYAHGQAGDNLESDPLDPSVREALDRLDEWIQEADRKDSEKSG